MLKITYKKLTPLSKEFVSGEKFTYLGRNYRLKVYREEGLQKAKLAFIRGKFIATVPDPIAESEKKQQMQELFKTWYLERGKVKLQSRLDLYCAKMGVTPKNVQLKEQKMRWGSCTPEGNIYLNLWIIMSPMPIIDYVLVHELAHLKFMNHSTEYWKIDKKETCYSLLYYSASKLYVSPSVACICKHKRASQLPILYFS